MNSSQISEQLVHEDGFRPELIRVVHNGIDVASLQRLASDRERLFPGLGQLHIDRVTGNMHSDVKGHPTLIEAADRICVKFPEVKFVLIGDGEEEGRV